MSPQTKRFLENIEKELEHKRFTLKWDTPNILTGNHRITWVNLEEKQEEIKNNKN